MRNLLALAGSLCITAAAAGQGDTDPMGQHRIAFDDGCGENLWKVQSPNGASDWFNTDMDGAVSGAIAVTVQADFGETGGFPGDHADLGIYTESTVLPNVPGARYDGRSSPAVSASDAAGTENAYTLGANKGAAVPAGDHHVAVEFRVGDSHTWVAADTSSTPQGRSYFTATGYSTGALPFSVNWMLAVGEYESNGAGCLLINGTSSATAETNSRLSVSLCITFFGPTLSTPSLLYLCIGGNPFLQLLPGVFTITDGAFAGPCPMTWQICASLTCNTPTAAGVELCTIYADLVDLKPNGKPKLKIGKSAILNIVQSSDCLPSCGAGDCFGQRDDCILDSTIWKVQNPAGPSDWFNVNHGTAAGTTSPITTLTGVSVSSWDFCGFGPCWAEVGIYAANTSVDPSGCTPDVANPLASVGGSTACMSPAAGDWGCPLTFYDTADIAADSTTHYHTATRWPTGDSCTWLGSDTDGMDSTCGTIIPSNGCTSLFTTNSYSSPAVPFTAANWMMQIEWN